MDTADNSPGSDAVTIGLESEPTVRPGTANTAAMDEVTPKSSPISIVQEEPPKETVKITAPSKPKKKAPIVSQMNQYAVYDKNHPLNRPFPAIQNFKGPKSSRGLT